MTQPQSGSRPAPRFAWEVSSASLCEATVLLACKTPPCPRHVTQNKREKPALPSGHLIRREVQSVFKRSACFVTDSGTRRAPNPHKWYCLIRRPLECECVLSRFSCVRLFATPWTVALQAPLSMGFSRQEYWSGLPCPPPGDIPDPALAGRFFTTSTTWEAPRATWLYLKSFVLQPSKSRQEPSLPLSLWVCPEQETVPSLEEGTGHIV